MRFESLSEFLLMGGHGIYVWAAYGIALVVIVFNLWWPIQVHRRLLRSRRAPAVRQQAQDGDSP